MSFGINFIRRRPTLALMAWAAIGLGSFRLQAGDLNITGVVKDGSGHLVAGALVRLKSEQPAMAFMVVTDSNGAYRTPSLVPGTFTAQAFGAAEQSAMSAPLEAKAGQALKVDLTLSAPLQLPAPRKRISDAEYAKVMPEGPGKGAVVSRCTTCHTLERIVSARKTLEKWRETVTRMRDNIQDDFRPLDHINTEADLIRLDSMAEYLGKNFTPDVPVDPWVVERWLLYPGAPSHPNRNLPGALLKESAGYIAMEYSLPPNSKPRDIAVDPNGTAWVSEAATGVLGRFDPASGSYTRISLPPAKTPGSRATSVAVDAAGDVWFVDDSANARMLRYNPKTAECHSYSLPQYPFPISPEWSPSSLVSLRFSKGNVWATGISANWIVKLDPATQKTTEYPVPRGSSVYGLAVGGDNRIWYAGPVANVVGRLDPANGLLASYKVTTPKSEIRGMAADGDGNLWVAATDAGKLIKADFQTGKLTEFDVPNRDSGPYSVDVDRKNNLIWFSEIYTDKFGRFDPKTNTFVEFPAPSSDLDIRRIEVDRTNPSRVWWAGGEAGKIGYIQVAR